MRILFVDDESRVLEGLQRTLRPLRHQWAMAFANSGEKALDILANEPFDVIVTDMRMPGMDGATLLREVRTRHPDIVRVVLSGQSDLESVINSAGVTHRYLSKPCSSEALRLAVSRVVGLRKLLTDNSLKALVSRMTSLPSVPPLYTEVLGALKSPNTSIEELGRIIARDMGMTAKVLQLANSGFFGAQDGVSNPIDAVMCLGTNTIKALLLSIQLFFRFDDAKVPAFSIHECWKHSLLVGALAERIAKSMDIARKALHDESRVVGLLHDVGHLVLAANLPHEYARALQMATAKSMPSWAAEREVFGTTHAEVGAYLLGLWGLPDSIVEATAYHHSPMRCPADTFGAIAALHIADGLERERHAPESGYTPPYIDLPYVNKLGVADRLGPWRESLQELVDETGEI
jgi:HD-like signal output (HDOD) protein